MKKIIVGVVAVALLAAAGCSSVVMKQPFAAKPDAVDQAKLEGVWQAGTSYYFLKFDARGVGQLHVPGFTTNGEFRVDRVELIPAKGEDGTSYFCVRARKDGEWPAIWSFAEYAFADDDLIMSWPDPNAFEAAVTNKLVTGDVKKSETAREILLDGVPDQLLKFFDDPKSGKLFNYRNPIRIKRLSEKADLLE